MVPVLVENLQDGARDRMQARTGEDGGARASGDLYGCGGQGTRTHGRFLHGSAVGVEGQARPRRAHLGEVALELGLPRVPAHLADQELHAVALLVLVVAEAGEDLDHRLPHVEDVARGQEIEEDRARPGQDGGAATCGETEAAHGTATLLAHERAEAEVVDRGEDVLLRATLERYLELTGQMAGQGMA